MTPRIEPRLAKAGHSLADSLYSVGYHFLEAERGRDAADVFRTLVLVFPADERGWLGLGAVHEALEQADVALELYSLATLAVPEAVRARIALARVLRARGDDIHADAVLDAAAHSAETRDDAALVRFVEREREAA